MIPTLFSNTHHKHSPTVEFQHGYLVPYFETAQRVDLLRTTLQNAGIATLVEPHTQLTIEELAATHEPDLIEFLRHTSENAPELVDQELNTYKIGHVLTRDPYYYPAVFSRGLRSNAVPKLSMQTSYATDGSSPIGEHTWQAAFDSANVAYVGAQMLLQGEHAVYALCRPPGHHAGRDFIGGYCFLNNAAVAANLLKKQGRVALFDIDYHHGNGTQAIFWNDPDVFYVSIHIDPQMDYPYYSGFATETGDEDAPDTILNLPLPSDTEEAAYLQALDQALAAIRTFAPHALVISLGFDTYCNDPIASFQLDTTSFNLIGQRIATLGLPTLYVQEGGYSVEGLAECAVEFFTGVLG